MLPLKAIISGDFEHSPALVRALRSLTIADVDLVTGVIEAVSSAWSVQSNDDYDGYRSILIEPATSSANRPSYFISGKTSDIELTLVQGDNTVSLGHFADMATLAEKLAQRL